MSDHSVPVRANEDRLLTTAEAAAQLGCTAQTLRRWVRLGKVPAVKFPSGRFKFDPSDIESLLEPRVVVAAPAESPSAAGEGRGTLL